LQLVLSLCISVSVCVCLTLEYKVNPRIYNAALTGIFQQQQKNPLLIFVKSLVFRNKFSFISDKIRMYKLKRITVVLLLLAFLNLAFISVYLFGKHVNLDSHGGCARHCAKASARPNEIQLSLNIMDIYRLDISCDYIVNDLGSRISEKYVNKAKNCSFASLNADLNRHLAKKPIMRPVNESLLMVYRPKLNLTLDEFNPFSPDQMKTVVLASELKDDDDDKTTVASSPCSSDNIDNILFLVPFTNTRLDNLKLFLINMHSYLTRYPYRFKYRILVVEQVDFNGGNFNKGRLLNKAFSYATQQSHLNNETFDCVVIHDVDLIPSMDGSFLGEQGDYRCRQMPWHLSRRVFQLETGRERVYNQFLTGGILSLRLDHFRDANGFSNEYVGWGAEGALLSDLDFY
jgi:hypothetical protein